MGLEVLFIVLTFLILATSSLWIFSLKKHHLTKLAETGNRIVFFSTLLFYGIFISLFLTHQFEFNVVYQNSNSQMPWLLLLSSSWAGQAGSLFLWLTMHSLTLWIVLSYKKHQALVSLILLLNHAVILFLVYKAHPFEKAPIAFQNGIGLNPVLSHLYMSIHPPFAFLGYAMISLLFAFAISHLIKPVTIDWLVVVKKWVYVAFFALSTTIILGSLWAYSVLGWGGFWAFDPIENASLVTWIGLMLLIHHITWYQKQKMRPTFSVFLIIILFASVYHMVMLLRSGLMEKLTQHAYLGSNLMLVLMIIDIVYFLIPLVLFLFRYSIIETDPKKEYYSSTPYVKILFTILTLGLAGLLFFQINQPLWKNFLGISFPAGFSAYMPLFNLIIFGWLVLIQIPFIKTLFQRSRHKIQQISQLVTSYLLAILLTFLFLLLSGNTISILSPAMWCVFLASLWMIQSALVDKKDTMKNLVDRLSHMAIGFLIVSVILSASNTSTLALFVLPNEKITYQKDAYQHQERPKEEKAYIGSINAYPLNIQTEGHTYKTNPTIWTYDRKSMTNQIKIPSIIRTGLKDLQVIPKRTQQIEFTAEEVIHFQNSELVVSNRVFKPYSDSAVLKPVSAELIIKQYNTASDHIEPYNTEILRLTSVMNDREIRYETNPSKSELLGSEIHWSLSDNNTILLRSPDWREGIQYEIVRKPFMIGIKLSYLFLLLTLLARLLFFHYKEWGRQYLFPGYQHEQKRRRHHE